MQICTLTSQWMDILWKTAVSSEPCLPVTAIPLFVLILFFFFLIFLFILLHQNYAVAFQFYDIIYSFKCPR